MLKFAIPGKHKTHYCEHEGQRPSESVEMLSNHPQDGKWYIAQIDGTWIEDFTHTKQKVRKAYMKLDTMLIALREKSPAQIASYIETNVTNLDSAKEVLKILAIAVSTILDDTNPK